MLYQIAKHMRTSLIGQPCYMYHNKLKSAYKFAE